MRISRKFHLLLLAFLWLGVMACRKRAAPPDHPGNPAAKEVPPGAADGVTFIHEGRSAIFDLYAPGKRSVYLIGDFNDWKATPAYAMIRTPDSTRWWIQVDGLDPAKEYAYQYYVDDSLRIADPYARKVLDPDNDRYIPAGVYPDLKPYPSGLTTGIVSVTQGAPPPYHWKTASFTRPDPANLVIYELLPRDFVGTHSYRTLADTLDYLVRLGVNAVELMPVNEFEGNDSWGYNSSFMFAPDKYYGTANDLKAFIDACHGSGMAVIQDIVLEDQFGSSPMVRLYATSSGAPAAGSPWFDTENLHPYAVGYQLNHESAATQYYTENVIGYWMQEYHIDGFRFDQAKGFTQKRAATDEEWSQYDPSRVAIWKNYYRYIKSLDSSFYVILEYFASDREESELAAMGMMMWNNLSNAAEQGAMGYPDGHGTWDLSRLFYDRHGFTVPSGLVSYFESHDEERLQFKNAAYGNGAGPYQVKDRATGLARDEMAAVFLLSSPGPKMLWQFGERGYDISIDHNGRLGDKEPHWEYMSDPDRLHLYKVYSDMIRMKINNPVFTTTRFKYSLDGAVKTIQLNGPDRQVEVIGNFDVVSRTAEVDFPAAGEWYDNIGGTSLQVTSVPYNLTLAPGEYHLYSNKPLKQ